MKLTKQQIKEIKQANEKKLKQLKEQQLVYKYGKERTI